MQLSTPLTQRVLQPGSGSALKLQNANRAAVCGITPKPQGTSRLVTKAASTEGTSNAASNGVSHPSNALDFHELSDIIRMVNSTDIVELELRSKRFTLAVRKKEALELPEPQVVYQQAPAPAPAHQYAPPPMTPPPPAAAPAAPPVPIMAAPLAPSSNGAPGPPPAAAGNGVEVKSPMAGMLYRAPAPGEPPFVNEGDTVAKGQTICIIEAMKLMNEIEADVGGKLVKFLAANASSVTPGQPLVLIAPQ